MRHFLHLFCLLFTAIAREELEFRITLLDDLDGIAGTKDALEDVFCDIGLPVLGALMGKEKTAGRAFIHAFENI